MKDINITLKREPLKIENEILILLESDMKENALEFVAYLNENQMKPQLWFGPGYWRVPYKSNYLCGIVINQNRWRVWFFKGDYAGNFEEEFIKIVQDHVKSCIKCTNDCKFGIDTIVFGKEYANVCFQFPIQFENPDSNTLEHIKELIEYWKDVVQPDDSWHAH